MSVLLRNLTTLPWLLQFIFFFFLLNFSHITVFWTLNRDCICLLYIVYFVCRKPWCPWEVICFKMELYREMWKSVPRFLHYQVAVDIQINKALFIYLFNKTKINNRGIICSDRFNIPLSKNSQTMLIFCKSGSTVEIWYLLGWVSGDILWIEVLNWGENFEYTEQWQHVLFCFNFKLCCLSWKLLAYLHIFG